VAEKSVPHARFEPMPGTCLAILGLTKLSFSSFRENVKRAIKSLVISKCKKKAKEATKKDLKGTVTFWR
jgi:hypothetical protein